MEFVECPSSFISVCCAWGVAGERSHQQREDNEIQHGAWEKQPAAEQAELIEPPADDVRQDESAESRARHADTCGYSAVWPEVSAEHHDTWGVGET